MVGFVIQVTDAAIAGDVRLKKQRNVEKTLRCSVVPLDRRKSFSSKTTCTYVLALIIATAAVKQRLAHSIREGNPTTWNHISNVSDTVAVLTDHQSCCRLSTL